MATTSPPPPSPSPSPCYSEDPFEEIENGFSTLINTVKTKFEELNNSMDGFQAIEDGFNNLRNIAKAKVMELHRLILTQEDENVSFGSIQDGTQRHPKRPRTMYGSGGSVPPVEAGNVRGEGSSRSPVEAANISGDGSGGLPVDTASLPNQGRTYGGAHGGTGHRIISPPKGKKVRFVKSATVSFCCVPPYIF